MPVLDLPSSGAPNRLAALADHHIEMMVSLMPPTTPFGTETDADRIQLSVTSSAGWSR